MLVKPEFVVGALVGGAAVHSADKSVNSPASASHHPQHRQAPDPAARMQPFENQFPCTAEGRPSPAGRAGPAGNRTVARHRPRIITRSAKREAGDSLSGIARPLSIPTTTVSSRSALKPACGPALGGSARNQPPASSASGRRVECPSVCPSGALGTGLNHGTARVSWSRLSESNRRPIHYE